MTDIQRYEGPANATLELAPQAWGLAQKIARTEFVPKQLVGKPEAILACILTGNEVGISPMQSLSKIYVVDGRPAMAAELMRALILTRGHELWIEESNSTRCIIAGKRKGSERETRMTWTMDDAQRAKLDGKDNWRKYPTAMLLARATAALCRAVFPDVLAGISYTIEELEDGDFVDALPLPEGNGDAPPSAPPARARARRPATRGVDAPEKTEPDPEPPAAREEAPLPGEDEPPAVLEPDSFVRMPVDDDDEISDADLVDDEDTYEGPDQNLEGRAYAPEQIIAMRCQERGIKDRDVKLALCGSILGRELDTTKGLDSGDVKKILDVLNDDEGFADALAFATTSTEDEADGPAGTPQEPGSEDSPPPTPPSTSRRRPAQSTAAAPPSSWGGDRWRAFLTERGVKVSEVLREASRLAREQSVAPPGTLDDVAASGLAETLVGYVEDLSLERRK